MNKILPLLILVLLLFLSCGGDDFTGGATDIGNGYVSGTFIGPTGSQTIVSLATVDYYVNGDDGYILYDTILEGEAFTFTNIDSGSYTLWAGDGKENQFLRSHIVVKGDSTYINEAELKPFGRVVFDKDLFKADSAPSALYIPGTAVTTLLTIDSDGDYVADSLPAGTYSILLTHKSEIISSDADTITVISETTIEKTDEYSLVQLPLHPNNKAAQVLTSYGDTLWSGTKNGLGFYYDGQWDFESNGLNSLSQTSVNDISRLKGVMFLATDKGLLKKAGSDWLNIMNRDTLLELSLKGDTLWMLSANAVYRYYDESLESLLLDTLWEPQGRLTTFTAASNGKIWVGTDKHGVYYYDNSSWSKGNNFSNWETVTHNGFTEDGSGTIWLATEGEGLYYYQNGFWAKAPFKEYEGNVKAMCPINDSSLIFSTYDGTILHDIKGYTYELATVTFNKSAEYQIESIYVDSTDKIYLATNGQGIYSLELH